MLTPSLFNDDALFEVLKNNGVDEADIPDYSVAGCQEPLIMGKDNAKLIQHFDPMGVKYISTNTLQDAVQAAYRSANAGDTVLLSPCCASFDLFKNYEDRGEQFMKAVRLL